MSHKRNRPSPHQNAEPTPWDIVNVFGYAIGVGRSVLEYTSRKESKYNFAYCETRKVLRELRETCQFRRAIMDNCSKLSTMISERGKLLLPSNMARGVPAKLYGVMRECSSVEDMMCKTQFRVQELLAAFADELPVRGVLATHLLGEFSLGWRSSEKSLTEWCAETVEGLGGRTYFYHWSSVSSRFLRDDRDLVEELCDLHGDDISTYHFPYARCKSNRRAHLDRLRTFCDKYGPVVVELDTENLEASVAIAFLKCIEKELPQAISHVNVYLDGMEHKAWRHLSEFISSEVRMKQVTRVRSQKSVVDTAIIASVMEAKYTGKANGILLVSSDCDFLVLNSQNPDIPVCYCCAMKQASPSMLQYIRDKALPSVYIDYVVNDLMSARAEQECVKAHVASVIEESLPNLKDIVVPAVKEVCPRSKAPGYTEDLCSLFSGIVLHITNDGTVVVSVNEESVE